MKNYTYELDDLNDSEYCEKVTIAEFVLGAIIEIAESEAFYSLALIGDACDHLVGTNVTVPPSIAEMLKSKFEKYKIRNGKESLEKLERVTLKKN